MNLVSCDGCGVVLDKSKLPFPHIDDLWDLDDCLDETKAGWDQANDRYVPKVPCPVCGEDILKD